MNPKVIVVGDLMLDRYVISSEEKISPEGDFPLLVQESIDDRLGGAGNVALNLKSLGVHPILISTIGDDAEGKVLSELCNKEFGDSDLIIVPERPTTTKCRVTDKNYRQYLRIDREETTELSAPFVNEIIDQVHDLIQKENIGAIILQDYNKGVLNRKVIEAVLKLSRKTSIPLIADPKIDNFRLLAECQVFKPNLKELSAAFGSTVLPDQGSIEKALKYVMAKSSGRVFVTLGADGIFYSDKSSGEKGLIAGNRIENPDVSGAGDTVLSVLVLGMIQKLTIKEMATKANAAGAIVCSKQGVSSIDPNELEFI